MELHKLRTLPKQKLLEWSLVASNFTIVLFLLILMFLMDMASPLYLFLEFLFTAVSIGVLKGIRASVIVNLIASLSLFLNFFLSGFFLLFNSNLGLIEAFSLVIGGFISFLNILLCVLNTIA